MTYHDLDTATDARHEAITYDRIAQQFSAATGRSIEYFNVPRKALRSLLGRAPRTFGQFARDHATLFGAVEHAENGAPLVSRSPS